MFDVLSRENTVYIEPEDEREKIELRLSVITKTGALADFHEITSTSFHLPHSATVAL